MNEEAVQQSHDRSSAKAHFLAKMHRYKNLLRKKWWVLIVGIVVGLGVANAVSRYGPPSYTSVGRMIVSIKLAIPEQSVYSEEMSSFLGTQAALMQSGVVINRAHARVTAQNPGVALQPVKIKVVVMPKTSIFLLEATGEDPKYAQLFLQACMEEYSALKKEMRTQTSDQTVAGLTEEVLRLEKDLRKCDEELVEFQSTNSVVLLQEQGNSAGSYLAGLNRKLADVKSEYDLLQALTLDQNLERRPQLSDTLASDPNASSTADRQETDYLKAKQQILLLKADMQEMGQYLRPKHPKMVQASEEIARRERLLEIFRQQSATQLDSRKESLQKQIKNLEKDIKEWDLKTLEISHKTAEYAKLKANQQRIQALYDRLLTTMQQLDVNKEVTQESVTIMENASQALQDLPKLPKLSLICSVIGFGMAIAFLLFLDRLDDRMATFMELQELFDETMLGQIPKERATGPKRQLGLIMPDDTRHSFVEAYRNLRSSLLFMDEAGKRPKILLLTSSVPNEGKSMTSSNLAITLASSGARVLLVDADLRKGVQHNRFGLKPEPGFSEVLSQGVNWEEAVQTTKYPNLFLLARGAVTQRSSEYFISPITEKFLRETAAKYDFVLLDTAPVMAADDVTSLAPHEHVDGVVFVIRAEHTSARVARASLELLYNRQVDVLGLVFNAVRPTSVDYYYYYKYKDYYKGTPGKSKKEEKAKPEAQAKA